MMIKKLFKFLCVVLISASVLTSCTSKSSTEKYNNQEIAVKIGKVLKDNVEEKYIAIGEVLPNNQVDVYLNTIGEIENIFVQTGDFIEKDMPMIQLVDENVNTKFNTTESQLRTIRDNLALQYASALENYNQQKLLFESGATSQNIFDDTYDELIVVERKYKDARINYNNQVSNLKLSVNDLLVKSPIKGQIAALDVEIGQNATNQKAITIIDTSKLYVKTMVSSELKKILKLNQKVRLKLEGLTNYSEGVITSIDEVPNLDSKLFKVKIEIEEDSIDIGDFAEIEFITKYYKAKLVPSISIVRRGNEKYLFKYENEMLKKVLIETGLSKENLIEVISDEIDENTKIIVSGQNNLNVNDDINIVE